MAIKRVEYNGKSFDIAYTLLNSEALKDIVFLHGWGSHKELMQSAFGGELKEFRHIYIDLMGFGKSSNEYILDTFEYAKVIEIFLSQIKSHKDIIVGHSFGGKVATLLNPDLLVLLSSAGIVEKKPLLVRVKIITSKVLGKLGLQKLTQIFRSQDVFEMSEVMYETFKKVVDEDFSDVFKNFSSSALVFWGKEDSATPIDSGKKIANLIEQSQLYEYGGDHYFFLSHHRDIAEKIKEHSCKI